MCGAFAVNRIFGPSNRDFPMNARKTYQLDLTASEWSMILTVLGAYQHNAAYRDLHGKISMLAKSTSGVSE
ncbi:hypothetical protein, partial [Terrabacter sp. 2RAF25]|uniref:hypothetical protein n=1 Tax=Terrabacter sp. 2RAF25 TaxID=3232998 RepID=UPI003F97F99B